MSENAFFFFITTSGRAQAALWKGGCEAGSRRLCSTQAEPNTVNGQEDRTREHTQHQWICSHYRTETHLLRGITKLARHHASFCLQIPTNTVSEANLLGPSQIVLDETATLAKVVAPLLLLHDIPQILLLQPPCCFIKFQVQLGRKEVIAM